MPTRRLDAARTAVLLIDLQEKLLPAIAHGETVARGAVLLLKAARVLGLPVILTTQYAAGLGRLVPAVTDEAPGVVPFDKTSFGAMGDAAVAEAIAGLDRSELVVAGVESHVCVAQTVLAALAEGYRVHVAADAVGSRRESDREIGLHRMDRAGAVISSVEMAVYELLGRSDRAEFKALRPDLKG